MRELTSHKVNGLNEVLRIEVLDEPGAGGASHAYDILGFDTNTNPSNSAGPYGKRSFGRVPILFQNGPIAEAGANGISQEALLAIVQDRLNSFQAGPYATEDNAEALAHVRGAMECLHRRTKERVSRGVEGTMAK